MSVTDRILTALTTVIRMNDKVQEMAGLMKEQQRPLALHRSSGASRLLLEADGDPTDA
jgi:hypothetical protein